MMGKCLNPIYPEYNGKECQCVNCLPIGYCVDDPCIDCFGPVKDCCLDVEDAIEEEN